MSNQNQECCPRFDPTPWEGTTHEWNNKKFVKDKVFTLFYMPMNFGGVITRLMKKIERSGTQVPDYLGLSDHTSKWNMDIYLAVDKEVSDAQNVELSGRYVTKVYEGPFKDTEKWCEDFSSYVKSQNLNLEKQYMWYTTCPKCAKKYGKNYVVIVGKIG